MIKSQMTLLKFGLSLLKSQIDSEVKSQMTLVKFQMTLVKFQMTLVNLKLNLQDIKIRVLRMFSEDVLKMTFVLNLEHVLKNFEEVLKSSLLFDDLS